MLEIEDGTTTSVRGIGYGCIGRTGRGTETDRNTLECWEKRWALKEVWRGCVSAQVIQSAMHGVVWRSGLIDEALPFPLSATVIQARSDPRSWELYVTGGRVLEVAMQLAGAVRVGSFAYLTDGKALLLVLTKCLMWVDRGDDEGRRRAERLCAESEVDIGDLFASALD